jgi:GLPGLI family protein
MKKILFAFFVFTTHFLFAQEKKEGYLVSYVGSFNNLFGRGNDFRNYHGKLVIQGDRSFFSMKVDEKNLRSTNEHDIDLSPDSMFTVYKDEESSSLLFEFTDLNQRSIYYADTLHPMQWEILPGEKTIGNMKCNKAITEFKGRKYIAWYTNSIPIANGPWKLGGLPGLIIEAYDEDDQWHVVCTAIKINDGYDFTSYDKVISKGVLGYTAFSEHLKRIFNRIQEAISAKQSGDCLTCTSQSEFKLHTWEKIQ